MEVIDSLSIYSNVIFCSNFFELANNEGFSVNFIDKRGEQIGRFIPQQWKKDFRTEYAQMRFVDDEKRRLKLAISFQTANIFNIRASLRYYERRSHNEKITNTIEEISCIMEKVKKASYRNRFTVCKQYRNEQRFKSVYSNPKYRTAFGCVWRK